MNRVDIKYFRLNADEIIRDLGDRRISGPLYVHRDGEPEAVIIRAKAWAPKLHDFGFARENGGIAGITCNLCPDSPVIDGWLESLGNAIESANKHWRDTHRNDPQHFTHRPADTPQEPAQAPQEAPTAPAHPSDSFEAAWRLATLYGCDGDRRARQIRINHTVIGWYAPSPASRTEAFYVLRDGRHDGPFKATHIKGIAKARHNIEEQQ